MRYIYATSGYLTFCHSVVAFSISKSFGATQYCIIWQLGMIANKSIENSAAFLGNLGHLHSRSSTDLFQCNYAHFIAFSCEHLAILMPIRR
jgi:hypothetical protein